MGDLSAWSLGLGRWQNVRIRLHVFFMLFAVQAIYMASLSKERGIVALAAASLLILLVSVLLHEAAHCWIAFRAGGYADQIVLWPLGGLEPVHIPHEPQIELQTALAGPLVNVMVMLFTAPLILVAGGHDLLGLLVPLAPAGLTEGSLFVVGLKLVFWINWLLVLVNLLPAFPFDGGRVMHALLWAQFDYRTAVLWVTRTAMVASVGICLLAWWTKDSYPTAFVPTWVALVLFAIFLWFGAQQEISRLENGSIDDDFFGYDFSQGYTSLERDANRNRPSGIGLIRRWLEERREAKRLRQEEADRLDEQQMDSILARLHALGIEGLSPQERAILDRVSKRYRNRLQS
jgi:stage IV sporulation protein FB